MKRARLIGGVVLALLASVFRLFWGSDAFIPAAIALPSPFRVSWSVIPTTFIPSSFACSLKAGVTYGLVQGWPLEKAVSYGIVVSGLIIQAVGAITREPKVEEVLSLIDLVRITKDRQEKHCALF